MIKKSLLTTLLLLLLHGIIVWIRPVPQSQYSYQENMVKAQTFIYEEEKENIIIGSSLSNRMITEILPGIYNLSFTGLGIFDGLQIISLRKIPPKNVFIEINIIQREENTNFLSHINSPVLAPIKKHIPSLRDGYQPVGIFAEHLMEQIKGGKSETSENIAPSSTNSNSENNEAFNRILGQEVIQYTETPDEEFLNNQFRKLKNAVHKLERNHCNVVFFEMPVNEKLCELPRPRMIRKFFNRYFPPSQYEYIEMPDCTSYKTTDGVHLSEEEALRYTIYFRSKVSKITSPAGIVRSRR